VNFTGALNIARLSYPHLKKSKGTLLLFSSSSYTRGRSGYATYAATKAAIVNLTQGLSEEWEEDDIRVNCIIPGRTDTKMRTDNFINEKKDTLYSPYHVAIQATQLICSSLNGALVRVS
jgi:2-C-methyl-D-erythritol 4-phosphate cytidylyltransferase